MSDIFIENSLESVDNEFECTIIGVSKGRKMRINAYKTAITRKKPSLPMRWLAKEGLIPSRIDTLDYGCGKGFDADYFGMDKYDPHFFPNTELGADNRELEF